MCIQRKCVCGGNVTKQVLQNGIITFHCDICGYQTNAHMLSVSSVKAPTQNCQHTLSNKKPVMKLTSPLIISCVLVLVFCVLMFFIL